MRCPKRTVSRRDELSEAKWSELEDTEKRRFVECFSDSEEQLQYGYVALSRGALIGMQASYLLHDSDNFRYDRDVSVMAWCYAELVNQLTNQESGPIQMMFDKFFHSSQSDDLKQLLSNRVRSDVSVDYRTSHSSKGIQAADCLAGAASEHERGESDWLDELNGAAVNNATEGAQAAIQMELMNLLD
jgi:hypothetical protein